jgi:hypothetical protein
VRLGRRPCPAARCWVLLKAFGPPERRRRVESSAEIQSWAGPDLAQLVGRACAGKTTVARALADAYRSAGYEVQGAALAGKAAEELAQAAGIPSRTLASLEYAWFAGRDPLGPRSVLVVDEGGMLEVRQLARVLDQARQGGAKVVLIGDPDDSLMNRNAAYVGPDPPPPGRPALRRPRDLRESRPPRPHPFARQLEGPRPRLRRRRPRTRRRASQRLAAPGRRPAPRRAGPPRRPRDPRPRRGRRPRPLSITAAEHRGELLKPLGPWVTPRPSRSVIATHRAAANKAGRAGGRIRKVSLAARARPNHKAPKS